MTYRVIVADPPWSYKGTTVGDGNWDRQTSKSSNIYETLSTEDICKLPVKELVQDNSYCFLWITSRHLLEGFGKTVLQTWGFRPITVITWCKSPMSLGYYVRNASEHIAFGVRGSPGQFDRKDYPSWFEHNRLKHSQKPPVFYESHIPTLTHGPYLDLFARERYNGWASWGKEVGDPDNLGISFDPEQW